jgi:hypothetical protein
MSGEKIIANGVNGLTGDYLLPPLDLAEVAARAKRPPEDPEAAAQLRLLHAAMAAEELFTLGVPFDIDPSKVEQAGWGVVFSTKTGNDVKAALEPLIEHRRRQIGGARTKVLEHRPGEGWTDWLGRHRAAPGNIKPENVPYYLLLVGGPNQIPFSLQYLLDTEYAVGRLDFDDAGSYRDYVAGLINYENANAVPHEAATTFFGTQHPFDGATQLSANSLVRPLIQSFQRGGRFASAVSRYRFDEVLGGPATKARLCEILSGSGASGRPALLFSASHGMGGWPSGHIEQRARHGALLCQDWPGLGQISHAHYVSASDVPEDARVHGLVAFFFACFGAGTPQRDTFVHIHNEPPPELAPEPFVSALPKRLLSHPEGGALAVIGHIDRAWGYSFMSGGEAQLLPFQNALGRILLGQPVGYAMKDFNEKYAALSANLASLLEGVGYDDKPIFEASLARVWTERNDAQNYVVLGDPAAALRPSYRGRSARTR